MSSLREHVLLREGDKCTSNPERWSKAAPRKEQLRVVVGVGVGFVEKLGEGWRALQDFLNDKSEKGA